MNDPFAQIRDVFLEALDRKGLESQLAYAAEQCADSPDLHAEVEEMLRAHHDSDGFLESQAESTWNMPAIALAKTGKPDEGRSWFNRGVEWMEQNKGSEDEELVRLQGEAEKATIEN